MFYRKYGSLLVIMVFAALLALWGCPKKTEVASSPEGQTPTAEAQTGTTKGGEAGKTETKPGDTGSQPAENTNEAAASGADALKPIHFDFDKSLIRDDAKDVLQANAAWLKAHPKAKVKIEGNCDERGTKEYNQALGQRRAASAKKYLTALGISGHRISLISYGKEKPLCTESTEDCWQKNRRDDFAVHE